MRDSPRMVGGTMGAGAIELADLATTEPLDKAIIETMILHRSTGIMM